MFRQPSPTCRTAFSAQHLRPSGVLSCWSDGLELTTGFYPESNEQHTVLGVYLKCTCSCVTSASSALGVLNDYALYKSTHSLTHSPRQRVTSSGFTSRKTKKISQFGDALRSQSFEHGTEETKPNAIKRTTQKEKSDLC